MQNTGKGGFRIAKPEKTREQIEYEDAAKNIKVSTTKLRLSQQGIDTTSISRQGLDRIMALYDKMDAIAADVRNKTAEIQRESNNEIQKINQRANEKYTQVSKDIEALINKMKKAEKVVEPIKVEQPEIGKEEAKEDVEQDVSPEKIKEDIIGSITNRVTEKIRREVFNAIEEYASMPQIGAVTIGQGVVNKEVAKEIAVKVGQDMIEKSSKVEPGERPADKDIPIITPEMMEKTDEEIVKMIEEKEQKG